MQPNVTMFPSWF